MQAFGLGCTTQRPEASATPSLERPAMGRASLFRLLIATQLLAATSPATVEAHLSIIRQGRDSAGSLEEGDRHGSALAVGDFNSDTYDDLAIAAPHETVSGKPDAGAVVVVYGSPRGLTEAGAYLLTADSAAVSSQTGARFGFALSAGDFDGDGDGDLSIGEPLADHSGKTDAGRVHIFLGSPEIGIGRTGALSFDQSYAGVTVEDGDEFGGALAAGFFNDDTRADLAVGSPGEDASAGAVFYFPGDASDVVSGADSKWFKQTTLGGTSVSGDRFGEALAAGHLFGTPHDDLAAGAPFKKLSDITWAGMFYVLRGSAATGLVSTNPLIHTAADVDGMESLAKFGRALAIGQFADGDYRSLAIGEPGRDVDGIDGAGRVVAVKGGELGLDFALSSRKILTQSGTGSAVNVEDEFGWALAAGEWGGDGLDLDDLAVGAPADNDGAVNAGVIHIFLGSTDGPTTDGSLTYKQYRPGSSPGETDLSDPAGVDDLLGYALAFGRFDGTGRANLAAGAPGQDDRQITFELTELDDIPLLDAAGCVFIVAPWRQVLGLSSRHAVVTNCEGELVFSQRPFDRVRNASTGKIFYAYMLATVGPQDPGYPDLDADYTVPDWIPLAASSYSRAKPPLEEGEEISLRDMCRFMMWQSASDCELGIADVVDGIVTPDDDVSVYLALMNQTGEDIVGLEDTQSLDGTNIARHYSTAEDMVRLWRTGMEEPFVADILSTESARITRRFPFRVQATYYNDNLRKYRKNLSEYVDGVKTGGLSGKDKCRMVSASIDGRRVVAGIFGLKPEVTATSIYRDFRELFKLGFDLCEPPLSFTPPPAFSWQPMIEEFGMSTEQDSVSGGAAEYGDGESDTTDVFFLQEEGSPAAFGATIGRPSEGSFKPGESGLVVLTPFQSHRGFRLFNPGSRTATLQVSMSHPPLQENHVLPPGGDVLLPPYMGTGLVPSFTLAIQNAASDSVVVGLDEQGYDYAVTLGGPGESFSCRLVTGSPLGPMGIFVFMTGGDPNPDNRIRVVAGSPEALTVAVDEGWSGNSGLSPFRLVWAGPNPIQDRVSFVFDLGLPGFVEFRLYDVMGREVRRLASQAFFAGRSRIEWDCQGPSGQAIGPGIYFYRFTLDGRSVLAGKLALTR